MSGQLAAVISQSLRTAVSMLAALVYYQ